MKLYLKAKNENEKEESIGANVSLDIFLSKGNKKEYTICFNDSGLMVYKIVNNKGGGIVILDTITKCDICGECINGMITVHGHSHSPHEEGKECRDCKTIHELKGKSQKGEKCEHYGCGNYVNDSESDYCDIH